MGNNKQQMNKILAIIFVVLATYSLSVVANEQSSSTNLHNQFEQLSNNSLADEPNMFESPMIFIEQEFSQQLAQLRKASTNIDKTNGQWSVSFDLNKLNLESSDWSFKNNNPLKQTLDYDWALGTSLVSPDQTSRFFVNYGERKVPISISFDDLADGVAQSAFGLGLEQKLNESWAISISYLKTSNELSTLVNDSNNAIQEHNYSFDFSENNRLETVNFSPFNHHLTQPNFLNDISAIKIKVSRKISDDLLISAQASQSAISFMEPSSSEFAFKPLQSNELSLQGQYELNSEWSLGAGLEHKEMSSYEVGDFSSSNIEQLNSTTLDIGVQYQSDWDQLGVVIRIDLMNLLGVNHADNGQRDLNEGALRPFSFDTPKYIKVSGSVSF